MYSNEYQKKYLYTAKRKTDPLYNKYKLPKLLPSTIKSYNQDYYYKRDNYGTIGSFTSLPPLPPPLHIKNPTTLVTKKYLDNKYQSKLAKYPNLNPMFDVKKITNPVVDYKNWFDNILDDSLDEFMYLNSQRESMKKKSKEIVKRNTNKISLIKGDVVNIDKKTLVYENYSSKTGLHIFKDLLSLKIHEYDLDKRDYVIVIPKILKHDIITPKNSLKTIEYRDPYKYSTYTINETSELSEGYLSDLENGNNQMVNIPSEIIENYVSDNIESIYNIEKISDTPKIVVHEEDEEDEEDNATEIVKKYVSDVIDEAITNCEKNKIKNTEEEPKSSWCSIM